MTDGRRTTDDRRADARDGTPTPAVARRQRGFQTTIEGRTLRGTIDLGPSGAAPSVVFLHGAGRSDRRGVGYIARELAAADRSVLRFDFSGHGESSGRLSESSLARRLDEALHVIGLYAARGPLAVVGTSMGGHVAALLTRRVQVSSLVLFCPAAYAADAFAVPFTEAFTRLIRMPGSYLLSDAFDALADFRGRALLVSGELDETIPTEVVQRYYESLAASRHRALVRLAGCPHAVHDWLRRHPQARRQVLDTVRATLAD